MALLDVSLSSASSPGQLQNVQPSAVRLHSAAVTAVAVHPDSAYLGSLSLADNRLVLSSLVGQGALPVAHSYLHQNLPVHRMFRNKVESNKKHLLVRWSYAGSIMVADDRLVLFTVVGQGALPHTGL